MANDPNTIQYVIQEDGFWYIASKEKNPYVPYITVSAKGVANGLSTEYNDGYDFGPDSYNPSVTSGVPLTQTSGIQEAWAYAKLVHLDIEFTNGTFYASTDIHMDTLNSTPGVDLYGHANTQIAVASGKSAVLYLGTNMNIDAIGFSIDIICANTENITFTRNTIGLNGYHLYLIAPLTAVQFISGNYISCPIFYSSSVSGTITSGNGATITGLIISNNSFLSNGNAIINFNNTYGDSSSTIDSVLFNPIVFQNNISTELFDTAKGSDVILPYITYDSVIDLKGILYSASTSSTTFLTVVGYFTPTNQVGPTTVSGTTAGSFIASQPQSSIGYKKIIIYLDGYENDTTTAQTYTFPVPFSTVAAITSNTASVPVVSTSLTEFSIAPDTTTAYTGIIVIEGY